MTAFASATVGRGVFVSAGTYAGGSLELAGKGATQRYVALYHFASPEVPGSAEWRKAADTPWTQRLRPHFRDMVRFDCRRYSRAR